MSDHLVENIRKENYPLQIFEAFGGAIDVTKASSLTFKLTSFIQDVYRSFEPGHFKGQLFIVTSLDDSIMLDEAQSVKLIDRNVLVNNNSKTLVLQYFLNGELPLVWQDIDLTPIKNSSEVVIYNYENFKESFIANKTEIKIINRFDCASIYALQYHYLSEALLQYKQEKIRYSSCVIFQGCLYNTTSKIYFNQQPEAIMQMSLREFLDSKLRGVDVVREYNLGASKPVDVRVYWKEANRSALIEIKWLGKSVTPSGTLSTGYSNGRGNDGLDQIKEYMDLENTDTPTCITKGYLVIIDGRRRGVDRTFASSINHVNGMYYSGREVTFEPTKDFSNSMIGFEKPIRMFVEPICS